MGANTRKSGANARRKPAGRVRRLAKLQKLVKNRTAALEGMPADTEKEIAKRNRKSEDLRASTCQLNKLVQSMQQKKEK